MTPCRPCLHRLRVAFAAVALTVLVLCGCSGPQERHDHFIQRGQRYLAEGKLDKALVEFRSALQLEPGDITARVLLGHVMEREGNIREAFGDYRAAVDLDPQNPVARASLARVYVFAEEPQTALELVEPTLLTLPNDPELLTVRGAARAQLKDVSEAFADAQRAVAIAPKNENAIALLASLYQSNREPAKAVTLLTSSIKAIPSSLDLRQILASLYISLDEEELAEQQLTQVVKIAPGDFNYRFKLAQFYRQHGRLGEAERVLKEAVADLPDSNDIKLAYVGFVNETRSPAEGQRLLAQFIARDRDNYDLQLGFGALQLQRGDAKSSLDAYQHIVATAGDRPQALSARNRIAAILVRQGKLQEARALVSEVLQKSPRDRDALIMRGNIELDEEDSAAAVADLRAVLRDQPDDVPILRTLARAHLANGDPGLAEDSLRDAMKAAPRDVAVRIDLAQLLMNSNRYPAAIALLEETLLESPTSYDVGEALTRAYLSGGDLDSAGRAAAGLQSMAPKNGAGWFLAGLVAQSQHHMDEAQAQFEGALKIEPNAIDVVAALVRLDVTRGRLPQAFARADAAVAAQPSNPLAHNMRGELYLATQRSAQAITDLSEATRLGPKLWLPYRNLALAQIQSGDLKAATLTYETGIAGAGLVPTMVIDLAALYERQGRIDEAIKVYRTLHDRSPRLDAVSNNLAMLLVTYRKDGVSLNEARELTDAFDTSDSPSLLDTQGWVRFKSGDLVEAIPELEAAAARAPQSRVIHYHLGMAQIEAKQLAKARSNLESALQGGQSFAGADEARVALAKLRG